MGYRKPSKERANEEYLRKIGFEKGKPYNEAQIDLKKTFLIICEGENTEPLYFRSFPVPTNTVLIKGGCNSKNSLVDYALKLKNDPAYADREIWCVFDYDVDTGQLATQSNDFNSAIEKAESNGMRVAWSNDAFELWFVLHYESLDTQLSRNELYEILKIKWDLERFHSEAKTQGFCAGHYERHGGSQSTSQLLAIRRARALHEKYKSARDFSKQCPCTTVYLLVEELNRYIKN
jgi:hypothetical protein